MEKHKSYDRIIFPPEVIKEANAQTQALRPDKKQPWCKHTLKVTKGQESWSHDSEEEFFADYRAGFEQATYFVFGGGASLYVSAVKTSYNVGTSVDILLSSRADIDAVFETFERAAPQYAIPKPAAPPPEPWEKRVRVFIGHGRKPLWRELKDHLADKHGFRVEAYEVGARAGLTVRDILEDMLTKSSIAFLVLTGEDEDVEGILHARDNVIHELGLFQGRLGFRKGIVLLEEGVPEFSNIAGLNQIRFSRDRIQETFGEVLATIRREFSTRED